MTPSNSKEPTVSLNERQSRLMFDTMLQGVVFQDADGMIVSMNNAAERILGKSPKEFLGRTSEGVEHDTLRVDGTPFPGLEHPAMVALRTGHEVKDVIMGVYNPRQCAYRWICITAVPLFNEGDDRPFQVYTIFDDITDRKLMEEKLQTALSRFYLILSTLPYGILLVTDEGHVEFANQSFHEMFSSTGLPIDFSDPSAKEAILGPAFKDPDMALARIRQITRQGQPVKGEDVQMSNGRTYRRDFILIRLGDKPYGQLWIYIDITERKYVEDALRESEQRLRTVLENSLDGINMLDLKTGRYVVFSPAQVDLTGFSADELNGLTAEEGYDRVHPDDREVSVRQQRLVAAGNDLDESVEYRWKVKSGEYRWFSDRRKHVRDVEGNPIALVGVSRDITERKRIEEALAESLREKEFFEFSVVNSSQPFASGSLDGRIIYFNKAFEQLTGYTKEELNDLTWKNDLTPERYVEFETEQLKKLIETGEPVRYEKEYIRKDGSLVPIEMYVHLARDKNDKPLYFYTFFNDLTERKRAEEALIESRRKFESLFSASVEGVALHEVVYDDNDNAVDYRILEVNPSFETLTGIPKEKAIGILASELYGVGFAPYLAEFSKVAETGEPITFETFFAPMEKSFLISVFSPVKGQFATAFLDISERKKAESELEDTKARLEAIISQMPVGILVADAHSGAILLANDEIEKIYGLGFKPTEIKGFNEYPRLARTHLDNRPYDTNEYPFVRSLKGEVIRNELAEIIRPDGSVVFINGSAAPVYDLNGKIVASVALSIDVTEQVKIQRERDALLEETKRFSLELQRSNTELQQFAYVASHDLQEPLRMVISYLSLLEKRNKGRLDSESSEFIDFAVDGGKRMKALIDDLLDYSRLDAQGKPFMPVDMNAVVTKTIQSLEVIIQENSVDIQVDELPVVMADESQLIRVMQNLISNSIKYRSVETPMIRIRSKTSPQAYIFSIKDNGIGLNMEYSEKIFHMFQRLHSKDKYEGTGVGLAIVKKIIGRHGGRVWVESKQGNGATFFFSIPRVPYSMTKSIDSFSE